MSATSVEKIAPLIDELDGNISAIARKLRVTRRAIYNRIEQAPELMDEINDARERLLDDAESELHKQAKDGNTTALIFLLKTQAKRRGYVERQEVSGPDGGAIKGEVEIVWPDQREGNGE